MKVELRGSILIADPDRAERLRLSRVLGGHGYLPFESACQAEALALARDLDLDLALLDAYLPDGSGLVACAHLKRVLAARPGRRSAVRVIFMTRDPSRELRRDALSAGAYAVVPKPIRPRLVLATIEAALGQGKSYGDESFGSLNG